MICDSAQVTRWRSWSGAVSALRYELRVQVARAVRAEVDRVGRATDGQRARTVGRLALRLVGHHRQRRRRLRELVVDVGRVAHRHDLRDLGGDRAERRMREESRRVEERRGRRAGAGVQRLVAGRPEAEGRGQRGPVGRDVPGPVPVDDEVVFPVAVEVEHERDVARHSAEAVDLVDDTVARRGSVPDAVPVDEDALHAGPVDVADERHVSGGAETVDGGHRTSGGRGDVPDSVAEDDRILAAVAVHVGDERDVGRGAPEGERLAHRAALGRVDEPGPVSIEDRITRAGSCQVPQQADVEAGRAERILVFDHAVEVAVEEELAVARPVEADGGLARLRLRLRRGGDEAGRERERPEDLCEQRGHRTATRTAGLMQHGRPRIEGPPRRAGKTFRESAPPSTFPGQRFGSSGE
jgi:hypothetical protein